MANIYNIQQELLGIFSQIEENEGELTPEIEAALAIKEDEFKSKIEAYANIIKSLELDITGIKAEKARLSDLQKSKEKTIERLKSIMVEAINMFGNVSKTGSKFIDYGTGKVSLRKSESIELDDDGTKQFINRFFAYFKWLQYTNTFDNTELDVKEITDYCNNVELDDEETNISTKYTDDDLAKLQADFDFRLNLKDIITTDKGRKLIKAIFEYTSIISAKPVVDKKSIKDDIKSTGNCPTFAKYIIKQNVNIK